MWEKNHRAFLGCERERFKKKKKKISGYENLVLGIYRGVTSFTWKSNLGKFNL